MGLCRKISTSVQDLHTFGFDGVQYTLTGDVSHLGNSVHEGHYIAHLYTKVNSVSRINDDVMHEVEQSDIPSNAVYILAYRRVRADEHAVVARPPSAPTTVHGGFVTPLSKKLSALDLLHCPTTNHKSANVIRECRKPLPEWLQVFVVDNDTHVRCAICHKAFESGVNMHYKCLPMVRGTHRPQTSQGLDQHSHPPPTCPTP